MDTLNQKTRERQKRWLDHITHVTGLKLTPMAIGADKSASTLTRFYNSTDSEHILKQPTINKLMEVYRVESPETFPDNEHTTEAITWQEYSKTSTDTTSVQPIVEAMQTAANQDDTTELWVLLTTALEETGYSPGDILQVNYNRTPKDGDIVCAQINSGPTNQPETIWRIYEAPYLLAANRSATFRKPHLIDNQNVVVTGVVTGLYRPGAN